MFRWFHGDLTPQESAEMLQHSATGFTLLYTPFEYSFLILISGFFLIRFSSSQIGSFAASYVESPNTVKHMLLTGANLRQHVLKCSSSLTNLAAIGTETGPVSAVRDNGESASAPNLFALVQQFQSSIFQVPLANPAADVASIVSQWMKKH